MKKHLFLSALMMSVVGICGCSKPEASAQQTTSPYTLPAPKTAPAPIPDMLPHTPNPKVPTGTEMVPMRDGTKLATDIHLPGGKGPFPVVLVRTVYGRNNDNVYNRIPELFPKVNVAVVTQDTRGHGDSEGVRMAFAHDGWGTNQDGADTVKWVNAQPWCNGKIATWGASAFGITQVLMAPATDLLACQAIFQAPSNFYSVFVPGGVFQKSLGEKYAKMMGHEEAQKQYLSHPCYDDFWQGYNAEARAADITAPAVHVSGWFDVYPQGAINNFLTRQHNGGQGAKGNQKLIMGPWSHNVSQQVGEMKLPDNSRFDYGAYTVRFFNFWLQGDQNGIMDEPAVHYYVMGDTVTPGAPGNEWRTADDWPPYPITSTPYYLGTDGQLALTPAAADDTKITYRFDPADPCPTLGGTNAGTLGTLPAGPFDQRNIGSRPDVLSFATVPLTAPVEIAGPVSVRLFVSSDAPDTDFTAKLLDIYPDGRQLNLADGIQRVKFRNGFDKADPLPPGQVGELTIDMWSVSLIFDAGHRIGVQISSSTWPRCEVNPNTGEDFPKYAGESPAGDKLIDKSSLRAANNTVYMDKTRASALVLPVRAQ